MTIQMPEPKGTLLGHATKYAETYSPGLLQPIARSLGRDAIGAHDFRGVDVWRLYEFSWLETSGLPVAAVVELGVPASTPSIIESKSLKLYAMSFAMSVFESEAVVSVRLTRVSEWDARVAPIPGELLERIAAPEAPLCVYETDPELLAPAADAEEDREVLWSTNLFRSLCPVTGQPDFASVSVRMRGRTPSPESLLAYLVSYRRHRGFHEQCVEQIFTDLSRRIAPDLLEVRACFTRRGGIDINPFRSSARDLPGEPAGESLRELRQ